MIFNCSIFRESSSLMCTLVRDAILDGTIDPGASPSCVAFRFQPSIHFTFFGVHASLEMQETLTIRFDHERDALAIRTIRNLEEALHDPNLWTNIRSRVIFRWPEHRETIFIIPRLSPYTQTLYVTTHKSFIRCEQSKDRNAANVEIVCSGIWIIPGYRWGLHLRAMRCTPVTSVSSFPFRMTSDTGGCERCRQLFQCLDRFVLPDLSRIIVAFMDVGCYIL